MKKQVAVMVASKNIDEEVLKDSGQEFGKRLTRMESKIFRRKTTLSQSLLLENNYFTHDNKLSEQILKTLKADQLDFLPICFVEWNWEHFLEFFAYHFFFFFIFGPFLAIFMQKNLTLLRNMEFYGISLVFFVQCFLYMTNIYCTVSYFVFPSPNTFFVEILYLWILMFNVCIIIAAKYATFSPEKIQIFKNDRIAIPRKKKEQYMHFHTPNSYEARYIELFSAFRRWEFEPSLFYVQFFKDPEQKVIEEINKLTQELSVYHKRQKEKFVTQPLQVNDDAEQFSGYGVINKFFNSYENYDSWIWVLIKAWGLSLMMTAIPIIYRVSKKIPFDNGAYSMFYFIFLLTSNTYCTFILIVFLTASLREVKRKRFFMVQCGHLISPFDKETFWKRELQNIDILDRQSIECWSMIRQVCLDYARQYNIRTQAFYSVIILQCIFTMTALLLHFFGVVQFQLVTLIQNIAWTIIFVLMLSSLIVQMAHLNSFFDDYRSMLEDWKTLFMDLLSLQDYYFDEEIVPESSLYQSIIQKLQTYSGDNKVERLNGVIEAIDDALRNLNYDERNNSQTFYEVPVTFDLLYSALVGLGSLFGYAIQYYILN